MATRHHDDGRVCHWDQPDGTCAGLAVRRLSQDRVDELAEEIWAGSSGDLLPGRALTDARGSRAGASAQAAYRRHRDQERERWRPGWVARVWAIFSAASGAALLIGLTVGAWLALPMALLAAVLTWWRLRFRPSAEANIWRRQAAMQRRTAGMLEPLGEEGHLILHDITLPGWPASLDHLVVGPTGVWVVESGQRSRRLARRWQRRRTGRHPAWAARPGRRHRRGAGRRRQDFRPRGTLSAGWVVGAPTVAPGHLCRGSSAARRRRPPRIQGSPGRGRAGHRPAA